VHTGGSGAGHGGYTGEQVEQLLISKVASWLLTTPNIAVLMGEPAQ